MRTAAVQRSTAVVRAWNRYFFFDFLFFFLSFLLFLAMCITPLPDP